MVDSKRVRAWLEACLEEKGWSIAQLSRASGVGRRSAERTRKGDVKPNITTVLLWAYAFGVVRQELDNYLLGRSSVLPMPVPQIDHGLARRAVGAAKAIGIALECAKDFEAFKAMVEMPLSELRKISDLAAPAPKSGPDAGPLVAIDESDPFQPGQPPPEHPHQKGK